MSLDKRNLYRLPWSMNDNPIAWLEVTDICNLKCEGCYRSTISGHKPLEQVKEELRFFKLWRNPDNVSIAGGEPLLHPEICEIIAYIDELDMKPIVLTNAAKLTPEFLVEMKKAGLAGFTIHIDSQQSRPGWEDKTEAEHNQLRQFYADMIHQVGGLYTIFNATVFPSTDQFIPDILHWGHQNFDRVHGLVFITYRTAATDTYDGIGVDSQEIDLSQLSYISESFDDDFITGPDIYEKIKSSCPAYDVAGYLGGTQRHDSFKWLVSAMIGTKKDVYGAVGPKTMEIAQTLHHFFKGTYLAYLSNSRIGWLVFWLWPFDPLIRKAFGKRLKDLLAYPWRIFSPVRLQSIGIIQAPDLQGSGLADMCDSCPDMTVYDGKLINSCRMDEYRKFGGLITAVNKHKIKM
jgi:MoaA/NifB/PqqE/SkfB family radical SAM enzyme